MRGQSRGQERDGKRGDGESCHSGAVGVGKDRTMGRLIEIKTFSATRLFLARWRAGTTKPWII